ncbi:hypothetical protein OCK74_04310 [Chitinophagaceae bacterium LB-8]|uniref:Uncharacterized protein n=1 Tax=Paraflavisolibacter caeni TaxID=2982496 RepID=A0A9X2XTT7_9BACT|nr:DUF6515 family protein [Paraflavisolibacter caeni]MCU7548322.1 hypothetical protein [Paraflavisolibacter caeni]
MKIADPALFAFLLCVGIFNTSTAEAQRNYKYYDRDYYYCRPPYPVRVQRVVYDYHPRYVTPPYRGYPYYYDYGYYYRPYGSSIQVVAPPLGIRVSVLPRGYRPIYMGSDVFYYSNGIFYRRAEHERDYEVVGVPQSS